jgi:hypothetical protein
MESKLPRATGALVLLACVLFVPSSLYAQKAEPMPDEPRPGWQERETRMAAELKQMQEEAAKNPNRPSMAELRRELDQMATERDRPLRLVHQRLWLISSCILNVSLALALVWVLSGWRGTRAKDTPK